MDYDELPAEPNEWTDEQWIEWLKATDEILLDEPEEPISEVVQRIVQSTPGQVIGQAMLGMAQAIYGKRDDEVVMVIDANGEGTDEEPFAIRLDFDNPERSYVKFKPDPKPPN
jgi:hypothetical protein